MTDDRFVRDLGVAMTDLAVPRVPDYFDDLLGQTAATRQRSAWTFPERWLPMADITSRPALAPRVPWRPIAVALLALALIIGTLVAYIGSHRSGPPSPFGLAGNGVIVASRDGDISTIDPVTGAATVVVAGPEKDFGAQISPDGRHIAFVRERIDGAISFVDLVVAGTDGSQPRVITPRAIINGIGAYTWSPDSRSVLVDLNDNDELRIYDTTTTAAPRSITVDVLAPIGGSVLPGMTTYLAPFQPPDGAAILIQRQTPSGVALVRLDLATMDETVLAQGSRRDDLGAARWSPDGTQVVYNASPSGEPASQRLFIVNADGTGTRQLTHADGTWYDIDPSWSPTGDQIAFTRYQSIAGTWDVRPIGVVDVADGTIRDLGPIPRDTRAAEPNPGDADASAGEGFAFEWSPDGRSLIAVPGEGATHPVIIDVETGEWRNLDPIVEPDGVFQSWQRTGS
jgi:Tol biopolymer transport system component